MGNTLVGGVGSRFDDTASVEEDFTADMAKAAAPRRGAAAFQSCILAAPSVLSAARARLGFTGEAH